MKEKGFARSDKDEGRWRNVEGKEGERGILMKWMNECKRHELYKIPK